MVELDSPELGGRFNGTGHLSMMSTNNLDAFDFMLDWAENNIDNPIVQESCPSGPDSDNPGNGPKK